mmetsp:Transcript_14504/g.24142  ORF Transcript_14504/g.24142 Transcript_14504/m.24142 type:complete len:673 (-) Transcript_14504:439-2457(-)
MSMLRKRQNSELATNPNGGRKEVKPKPSPSLVGVIAGDLVEAVYCDGCWVPSTVLGTRAKRVLIEFDKQEAQPPSILLTRPHYFSQENETLRDIAKRFNLPSTLLHRLNGPLYPAITLGARLRRRTPIALPDVYGAQGFETPASIAQLLGLPVADLLEANEEAFPDLAATSQLDGDTQLIVPAFEDDTSKDADSGASAPASSQAEMILLKLGQEVEVRGPSASEWRPAQVQRILAESRFLVSVDNECQQEEFKMGEENEAWRRRAAGTLSVRRASESAITEPSVGDDLMVEVEEEERTIWRPATVVCTLLDHRFRVCVDGDHDFVEEYGMEDQGKEWMWPLPLDSNTRAKEWLGMAMVRPRPPQAPEGFSAAAVCGGTVQVWQDGGWWRARLLDADCEPNSEPAGDVDEVPNELPRPSRPQIARVRLLERGDDAPALRIGCERIRPDWEWSHGRWQLMQLRRPEASPLKPMPSNDAKVDTQTTKGTANAGVANTKKKTCLPKGVLPLAGHPTAAAPAALCSWAEERALGEAKLTDAVARGAWWAAEILEVQPHAALLLFGAFAEADGSDERLQEWVPWSRVRPRPPETPPDFLYATREGEEVQVWWEDAWWEATLVTTPEEEEAVVVRLLFKPHTRKVERHLLRPGWQWCASSERLGEWTAPCIAAPLPLAS